MLNKDVYIILILISKVQTNKIRLWMKTDCKAMLICKYDIFANVLFYMYCVAAVG